MLTRFRLEAAHHRLRFLAVDEFAIHKGHSYATCVLDLETGEAIWVGKGRAKADFARFFEEMSPDFLSCVEAVAMDMNASYNVLVKEHLPNLHIFYDRFHMQAQFGKQVLGAIRLTQAHEHKANVDAITKAFLRKLLPCKRERLLREKSRNSSNTAA